jgi:class 3 adenylate cyclase
MDIVVWLRSLGLGKYQAIFRENDIDETVLPSLTHENLKELGVASFGHRVKLLDAIAALRNEASVQTPAVAAAAAPPSATTSAAVPVAEAVGERRHVTVMFCDLVGSTSISAGLDAEDWHDLVGAYLDAASAAVAEMGGHVAKKLGDGLMALFGYPVAQENDAERAARAGLSIQRALAEVNRKNVSLGKPALKARIGIETGPVVVDAAGEIYGDAPNTACPRMPGALPRMNSKSFASPRSSANSSGTRLGQQHENNEKPATDCRYSCSHIGPSSCPQDLLNSSYLLIALDNALAHQ